jgi:hypothetical protein
LAHASLSGTTISASVSSVSALQLQHASCAVVLPSLPVLLHLAAVLKNPELHFRLPHDLTITHAVLSTQASAPASAMSALTDDEETVTAAVMLSATISVLSVAV